MEIVFAVISGIRLKLKIYKLEFSKCEVNLLGYIVTPGGVAVVPKKVTPIQGALTAFEHTSLRRFLVLTGYYRGFVKNVAEIYGVLYSTASRTANFYLNVKYLKKIVNLLVCYLKSSGMVRGWNRCFP